VSSVFYGHEAEPRVDRFENYFAPSEYRQLTDDERWEVYRLGLQDHPDLVLPAYERICEIMKVVRIVSEQDHGKEPTPTDKNYRNKMIGWLAVASVSTIGAVQYDSLTFAVVTVVAARLAVVNRGRIRGMAAHPTVATVASAVPLIAGPSSQTDRELVLSAWDSLWTRGLPRIPETEGLEAPISS
jgi:hypothetical protein